MNRIDRFRPVVAAFVILAWASDARTDIVFSGLDPDQETNIRAVMPLASAACDAARWRVDRLFRDADKNVRRALEALGFYEISISKALSRDDDCWQATIDIKVGDPVRIRQVDVVIDGDATNDPEFQSRISTIRPAPGDVLDHGRYDKYKTSLLRAAITSGYFDANYERSEFTVDADVKTADVVLRLQSGPRYRFGEVTFSEGILRRYIAANCRSGLRPIWSPVLP